MVKGPMNGLRVYGACVLVLLQIFASQPGSAQDSIKVETPSAITEQNNDIKEHSPKLATLLSAAIPGLGQVYNKKYWKVPIIYAGGGTLVYFINYNNTIYKKYKEAYTLRVDGDTNTVDIYEALTDDNLLYEKDRWRRYRDINIIFLGVLYMLNIVDAAVDAHFFSYKITDDLSMDIHPTILMGAGNRHTTGIGVTLNL